ncbi:Polyketide cyclase/dehydrase and lipid transport superfamily protein [Abeliophyllum distichum]|uniref:Polyketide cyclase/dehydrase and lipid transport superfamily protein n=1 Tax=Abeliophyllum distichum TaxID=126358 RepID=A0ABD1NQG7_9LAMI
MSFISTQLTLARVFSTYIGTMSRVLEVTPPIKSSPAKFYDFFKYHTGDLITVLPESFKRVQIVEGEDGQVGCVKLWNYDIGRISMVITLKTEAINDEERSITYKALGGDLIKHYKVFQFKITLGSGVANWTIEYEKASEIVPPPEIYGVIATAITAVVDLRLLTP